MTKIQARKRKVFRRKLMRNLNEFATFIAFAAAMLAVLFFVWLIA